MTDLTEALNALATALIQTAPSISRRLQPGLTTAEIEKQVATFTWTLPQDAFNLYQWHDGLSGKAEKLNLAERLLRLKGKWHGELAGRENEIHVRFADALAETLHERRIVAKFLPLEYALAGHRHLKLGRCLLDLLPIAILQDGTKTLYCLMRLDPAQPTLYCANGTNLPPMKVTATFLSNQPQFAELSDLVALLTDCCQQTVQTPLISQNSQKEDAIDCEINSAQFAQLFQ
jgi:hypothetical protein